MKWTKKLPTKPGWYWVYGDNFPCHGMVWCVRVKSNRAWSSKDDFLSAWVPETDYQVCIDAEHWPETVWMGPVKEPSPPEAGK